MANDMLKLGGLWTNKDKDGNTFLTGKLNPGVRILIFKNKYREAENHPTHIMYLSQVEQQPAPGYAPGEEPDEFDESQAPRPMQRYDAPEDVPPPPRPMAPRSAAPAPRPPAAPPARTAAPPPTRPAATRPSRQPAPPPDYDDDLSDPFAEE